MQQVSARQILTDPVRGQVACVNNRRVAFVNDALLFNLWLLTSVSVQIHRAPARRGPAAWGEPTSEDVADVDGLDHPDLVAGLLVSTDHYYLSAVIQRDLVTGLVEPARHESHQNRALP